MNEDKKVTLPGCYYRISVKALILDETRTKFLVVQELDGRWELPGGGLDWDEN
jgi:8-oxo-dGTP diphosphatase